MPVFTEEQLVGLMRDMEQGIVSDLSAMIGCRSNFPLALTLSVLTETLGGMNRGTFATGEGRPNYETGLQELGRPYETVLDNVTDANGQKLLYGVVRSVFVHTYIFSKTVGSRTYLLRVQNQPEAGVNPITPAGISLHDSTIDLITNTYAYDLVQSFRKLFSRVRQGDTQARDLLENSILSQRV